MEEKIIYSPDNKWDVPLLYVKDQLFFRSFLFILVAL